MASTEEVAPDAGATVKETLDTANPLADGTKALTESQQIAEREGADGVERFERKMFMSYPNDATRKWWDLMVVFLLMYVGITVPLHIGINITVTGGWKIFNYFIDTVFLVDMVIAFRTPFEVEDPHTGVRTLCDDSRAVVRFYMTGWFWIDMPTCIPFDEVAKLLVTCVPSAEVSCQGSPVKLLRTVRLVRLAKGLRVLKMMKVDIFKTIMETIGLGVSVKYYGIAMVKLSALLMILAHFNACAWYYFAEDDLYCKGCDYDMSESTNFDKYIAALYWAVQSMTTVGYGDMTAQTTGQRLLSIFTMYVGATVFGYIVGNMANILSLRNASKKLYTAKMDQLEEFMEDINVPEDLRERVRSHYKIKYENNKVFDEQRILAELPGSLGIELALHIRSDLIKCSPLLRDNHRTFAASVISHGEITVEQAGELVIRAGDVARNVYFMEQGLAEVLMTIDGEDRTVGQIREGDFFGTIGCLITDKHPISVVCQLDSKLLMISKEDFNDTVADHQDVMGQITETAQAKLAGYKANSARSKWECTNAPLDYEIIVCTGDETGGGTDVAVLLTLFGDAGQSDPINLHTLRADASDGATKLFGRGQMDKFKATLQDVGELRSIKIGFEKGRDAWLLDWVLVDIPGQASWRFESGAWLKAGDSYAEITAGSKSGTSVTGVKGMQRGFTGSPRESDMLLDSGEESTSGGRPSVQRLSSRLDGIELAITRVLNSLPDA